MNSEQATYKRKREERKFHRTELGGLEVIEYGDEVPLSVIRHFFPYMNKKVKQLTTASSAAAQKA